MRLCSSSSRSSCSSCPIFSCSWLTQRHVQRARMCAIVIELDRDRARVAHRLRRDVAAGIADLLAVHRVHGPEGDAQTAAFARHTRREAEATELVTQRLTRRDQLRRAEVVAIARTFDVAG